MHWFNHIGDEPDETTGMWTVHPSLNRHDECNISVIHVDTTYSVQYISSQSMASIREPAIGQDWS
ncbi:hypothetical protein F5141DRAFT_593260 [Pisolithus sp. B1]|nr:hypothetical protein F5141DRAFT_593260 [Pisolithus sp. B1]